MAVQAIKVSAVEGPVMWNVWCDALSKQLCKIKEHSCSDTIINKIDNWIIYEMKNTFR